MSRKTSNLQGYSAIEAVRDGIEKVYEAHSRPEKICVSTEWAARGFVYLTKNVSRYYILVHARDLDRALAWLKMTESGDLVDYFYMTPISYEEEDAVVAASGVYKWAFMLA